MTHTAPQFQRLDPNRKSNEGAIMCEMCSPSTLSSYCNPFIWVRHAHEGRQRRRLQEQQRRQAVATQQYAERRHTAIQMLKEHTEENKKVVQRAVELAKDGMHEAAEQQWGQVKPMRSPRNRSLMVHMGQRQKMLKHLPSTITEMRDTLENPSKETSPFGTPAEDSFCFMDASVALTSPFGSPEEDFDNMKWADLGSELDMRTTTLGWANLGSELQIAGRIVLPNQLIG